MHLPEITLALFSIFNVLRVASYLPQIIRVATDTDGARAISYSTWCLWIGANASTAAYALVNVADWALFAVSFVNAVGCAAVVGLTMWKRRHATEPRTA
jgi:hypothetical protein